MTRRIVLTHVNLTDGFTIRDRQMLLLIRALEAHQLEQQLVVKKNGQLHRHAVADGLSVRPITWPWRTNLAQGSDLVHAHNHTSWRWAAASTRPYLAGVDVRLQGPHKALQQSQGAVVATCDLAEQLRVVMPQINIERIPPLYGHGDSPLTERQRNLRKQYRGRFVFGLCCDYGNGHGVEDAIEAMRWLVTRNARAVLLIASRTKAPDDLRALARSLDCIAFVDEQPGSGSWYEVFDACLSPAHQAVDDNGLVQAMYTGLPIVATRLTAMDDFVEHDRTALLVESKNSRTLGEAMLRLMDDKTLATRLGRVARQRSGRFSPQVVAERTFRLYQSALGR